MFGAMNFSRYQVLASIILRDVSCLNSVIAVKRKFSELW